MSERLRSLRRIVAVREQLARLAEWRLAASEISLRTTEAAQGALDGFLESPDLGPALGGLAQAQTRRLATRVVAEAAARDRLQAQRRDAEQRLRSSLNLTETFARLERDKAERQDLEQLIEAATQRLTHGGFEEA